MNKPIRYDGYYDTEVGYIPEELFIWVPPKPLKVEGLDVPLERVLLDGDGASSALVFFVPKEWINGRSKSGWRTRLRDSGWSLKQDTAGLLNQFIRLVEAPTTSYLDFAKKWGPLWKQAEHFNVNIPDSYKEAPWIEPLEAWRLRAKEVKTVLEVASYIYKEELAPPELCQTLWPLEYENIVSIESQKEWLMYYINIEMLKHNIKFYINWLGQAPELKIGSTLGFLSAVWFQLLQTITSKAICLCDGCSQVYAREGRKPARGKQNYCAYCGTAAAKRDYASRKRQADSGLNKAGK
jgi:hypothetical protein